ncbi:MAG: hypothetical protein KDC12_11200 [Flavobacteriales bacterium]|nr:hypothetical protein [Flavobacteriales bacterium]
MKPDALQVVRLHWRNTLYSNVWISAGASAWVWQAEVVSGHSSNGWLPFLAFCSTIFIYNFQRIIKSQQRAQSSGSGRVRWMDRNSLFLWIWTIAGAMGLLACLPQLHAVDWLLLSFPGLISLLYIARIFRYRGKRLSGRQLPFIKIWLIGLSWAIMGTWFPLLHFEGAGSIGDPVVWYWFAEKLLFIVAITIPFDIRDLKFDAPSMNTFPQWLGVKRSKILAVGFLAVGGMLAIRQMMLGWYTPLQCGALWMIQLLAIFLVWRSHSSRPESWYVGWIDGTILLQSLAVISANYL